MGQVIEVGRFTSRVMLITDPNSAVPVQVSRNGIRAIAMGKGYSDRLELINVSNTTDIRVGDKLITSGLGLRFPVGYPVGEVSAVEHISGKQFASITITPSAHLAQSLQVLLVWPNQSSFVTDVRKMMSDHKGLYSE